MLLLFPPFTGAESWEEFASGVRMSLEGGECFDMEFERNLLPGFEDNDVVSTSRNNVHINRPSVVCRHAVFSEFYVKF